MGADLNPNYKDPHQLFEQLENDLAALKNYYEQKEKVAPASEQAESINTIIDNAMKFIEELNQQEHLLEQSVKVITEDEVRVEAAVYPLLQQPAEENPPLQEGVLKRPEESGPDRFSYKKAFKVIVLNRENIKILLKSLTYRALSFLLVIASILSRPLGILKEAGEETISQKLKFKAQVIRATDFGHKASKIAHCWAKKTFGDQLLVHSINIAQKDVLREKQDEKKTRELIEIMNNETFQETFNISERLTAKSKEVFQNEKFDFTKFDGECCGTALHFVFQCIMNGEALDKESLIKIAKNYEEGVPAEAAANQTLYQAINFSIEGESEFKFLMNFISVEKNKAKDASLFFSDFNLIGKTIKNIHEKIPPNTNTSLDLELMIKDEIGADIDEITLAWIKVILKNTLKNNLPLTPLENEIHQIFINAMNSYTDIENKKCVAALHGLRAGSIEEVGQPFAYESTEEQLKYFNELPPGAYVLGFDTWFLGDQGHAIAYVKTQNEGSYLLDPNYGLIQCDPDDPKKDLLKLLHLYPEKPESAGKAKANYNLEIIKFEKSEVLSKVLKEIEQAA
jgi:hypothetical protein